MQSHIVVTFFQGVSLQWMQSYYQDGDRCLFKGWKLYSIIHQVLVSVRALNIQKALEFDY